MMHQGTLKRWNAEKGYGFLITDGDVTGGRDVFLHISALHAAGIGEPKIGGCFAFDIVEGEKGLVAASVAPAGFTEAPAFLRVAK